MASASSSTVANSIAMNFGPFIMANTQVLYEEATAAGDSPTITVESAGC